MRLSLILTACWIAITLAPLTYGQKITLALDKLEPTAQSNCLIYYLRDAASEAAKKQRARPDERLKDICQQPQGWAPAAHAALLAPLVIGLNTAENAYCEPGGCFTAKLDLRLVLVGDPLPNAYLVSSPDETLTIVVTTTLMDFVQRTTHAVLNDTRAEPRSAPDGYAAWLDQLRAGGGKPCAQQIKWNTTQLTTEVREVLAPAVAITYAYIFAHELAHKKLNKDSGARNLSDLEKEKACDKLAFDRLTAAGLGMPVFLVATFVAWDHYITLKKPKLMAEFPGGERKFSTAFPALDGLTERARALVNEWERVCQAGSKAPLCFAYWQDMVKLSRDFLGRPAPAACRQER